MSSELWTAGMNGERPMYSGFSQKMWCMAVLNTDREVVDDVTRIRPSFLMSVLPRAR